MIPRLFISAVLSVPLLSPQSYYDGLRQGTIADGECLKRSGAEITSVACGGGSAAWGGITGTLSNQTDLQTALNGKEASGSFSGVGTCTNQFVRALNDGAAPTCATVATGDVANDAVTYAKLQNVTDARLLGRSAGSAGDAMEITVGSGLSLSGGNLTATGGADPWTYLTVNGGSDFTTSSASAVDVTGLSFTPTANTKYEFECSLALRTATATVNPRVGFAWSTGLTDGVAAISESQAATGTPLGAAGNPNGALLVAVGGLPNTTQSWPATITATIVAGASPSGTTRVQLASETAATNVTIRTVGSMCKYRSF